MKKDALVAAALLVSSSAHGALINASNYSLDSIGGQWAWGNTDWNAVGAYGYVDNVADLATVEGLLSDGYSYAAPGSSDLNGIYNFPGSGVRSLAFSFDSGVDFQLDSLSFISSRSYSSDTQVSVDYSLDGGAWVNALTTTAGALGIVTGSTAGTYTLSFGGVTADAFRFNVAGNQVSVHEILVDGSAVGAVPTPETLALMAIGILGIGYRRSKQSSVRN